MQTRHVIIRRFALGPLAQWGFVIGVVVACLPAFFCSWIFFTVIAGIRNLIAGWQDIGFEFLGQRLRFDLVEILNLQNLLQTLNGLAALGIFGILLCALLLAALLGVFGALVLTVLGIFYNTTGRVRLELQEVEASEPPSGGTSA